MSAQRLPQPFPGDATMPEIAVAVDSATMCRLLEHHVFGRGLHDLSVEDCAITRIRYRPHARCFLQYSVTLGGPCSAAASRQWVIGSLYAEPRRAARLARKLNDAVFIPELRMLVSLFPADHKLPQAAIVMAGGDAALKEAMLRTFGDREWQIDSQSIDPVRYREHLSLVARYKVRARDPRSGHTAERVFYLKAYPEAETACGTFDYLRELAAHAATDPLGVRIDAPIACLDHLRSVLLPSTEGRPLSEIIADDDDRAAFDAVRQAARGLARFHLSNLPMRRQYTTAEYLRSLERPVTILEWACPELGPDLRAVVAAVTRTAHDVELRPTHRDMKPEHILMEGGRIAFIDLDSCAAADPVLDVALMLARFAGAGGDDDGRRRTEQLGAAFTEEYFAAAPRSWQDRLPPYYASSLIEVAAGLFHRQEAHWRPRAHELLRAAMRATRTDGHA